MRRVLCAVALFVVANAWAETPEAALSKLLESNRNVEGDFHQVTYNDKGDEVQETEGEFILSTPNRFVWDTNKPFPQRITSDGEWVTIYDVDLDQATRKPFSGAVGNSPAALLGGGTKNVLDHYKITKTGQFSYQLSPKENEDLFDSLTLSFDVNAIAEMSFKDALGQTTVIEFFNVAAHKGMPESRFKPNLPATVDVMTEQ